MKIYSPTRTIDFMANPVNWRLRREGWEPLVYTNKEKALFAGGAYQAGLTLWYTARKNGASLTTTTVDDAVGAVKDELSARLNEARANGITWKDDVLPGIEGLPTVLEKTLRKQLLSDPIPQEWEILEVEPRWETLGYAKPDLVVSPPSKKVLPIDSKYKQALDEERKPQTLAEYAYSWQMMHYSWATEEKYGRPVNTHGLLLTTSRPHRVEPHYFPIDPVLKRLWLHSAKSAWAVMAAIDGEPEHLKEWIDENGGALPAWHTFLFHTRYGLDVYGEAVLYHKLDPYLMAQSYVNTKATGQEPGAPEIKEGEL